MLLVEFHLTKNFSNFSNYKTSCPKIDKNLPKKWQSRVWFPSLHLIAVIFMCIMQPSKHVIRQSNHSPNSRLIFLHFHFNEKQIFKTSKKWIAKMFIFTVHESEKLQYFFIYGDWRKWASSNSRKKMILINTQLKFNLLTWYHELSH